MSQATNTAPLPAIPPEVQRFAEEQGVSDCLVPMVEMTLRVFGGRPLGVFLEEDAGPEDDRYIALETDTSGMSAEQISQAMQRWSGERFRLCPGGRARLFYCGLV